MLAAAAGILIAAINPTNARAACQTSVDFTGKSIGTSVTLDVSTCSEAIRAGLFLASGVNSANVYQVNGGASLAPGNVTVNGATVKFDPGTTVNTTSPLNNAGTTDSYTVTQTSAATGSANGTATLYYASSSCPITYSQVVGYTNGIPEYGRGTCPGYNKNDQNVIYGVTDTAFPVSVTGLAGAVSAPTPTVSSIAPSSGPTGGGTPVTLTGTNFISGHSYTASFATSTVTAVYASSTILTATTPSGGGAEAVTVTDTTSSTAATGSATFTYVAAPTAGPASATVAYGSSGNAIALSLGGGTAASVAVSTQASHGAASASGTSISYTPTPGYSGSDSFAYTATNAGGTSSPATVSITVNPQAPTAGSASATVAYDSSGNAITLSLGGGTAASVAVSTQASHGTATPSGTSISYTPTSGYSGSDSFAYTATNAGGTSSPATVSVTVSPPTITVSPTTLSAGTEGTAYSQTLSTNGGQAPYSFSTTPTSGALPAGVSLSSGGTISGTPSTTGTFTFTVSGTDSSNPQAAFTSTTLSLSVTAPALSTTQAVPSTTLTAGTAATFTPVTASGGYGSLSYALSGATLPTGLTFSTTTGQITGAPSTLLTATVFTVTATDSTTPTAQTSFKTFSLTVNAAVNAITFAQPVDTAFTASPPTLSASATSGVAPTFSSNSASVCTVTSGGAITFVATGVCSITAVQGASGNYAAATSVTKTFNVTAGVNAITFAQPADTAFTASPPTLSASATSGVAPTFSSNSASVCTVTSGGAISFVATGVCSITAAQGAVGNYAAATSVTKTFNVTAGVNAITFAQPADTAFTASPPALSASATSGAAVSYSSNSANVCTVTSGGAITFVATGVCSITAAQGATGNYAAATSVTKTFNVTAGVNAITFAQPADTAFTASPPILSASATSGAAVSYSSNSASVCTVTSGGAITFVATGVCSITAAQGAVGNYAAATSVTKTFNVTAGANTITFSQAAALLGSAPFALKGSASSGLPVSYTSTSPTVCTVTSGGMVTLVWVGSCSITAAQPGNANYAAATPVAVQFAVTANQPVAASKLVTTAYNVAAPIDLTASITGVLNSANPVAVGTPPAHGGVVIAGEVVTYTPAANYFGPDSFTYTAAGPGGTSTAATVSITVSAPTITIGPSALPAGQQAIAYSQLLSAHGGAAPYAFSVASGTLPGGVTLTSAGLLSGTPTASGGYAFTIKATDSSTGASPATATIPYTLSIAAPPPPVVSPKAITASVSNTGVGQSTAIDLSSSVQYASGISIVTPPAHGAVSVAGFVVTYTPRPGYFGTDSFQYSGIPLPGGSANAGSGAVATVTITIPPPTLTITPPTLPSGKGASPYSQTLSAAGGTAPYTFSLASGALPAGLVLNTQSGILSGTPTVSGTFTFTVKATDSSTGTGPFSATQGYSLGIAALVPTVPTLTVTVPADKVGTADVSTGATGGPFTGGAVISVSPATAGTATIGPVSNTTTAGVKEVMSFTPAKHFSGSAVVSYTLSNSYATSAPGTVTFQVATRPDPTLDPDVRGLISDQTETALHFAEQQLDNFNQRLETLHHGGGGGGRSSLSISIGSGAQQPQPGENPMLQKETLADMASFGIGPGYTGPSSTGQWDKSAPSALPSSSGAPKATNGGGDQAAGGGKAGDDRFAYWIGGAVDFGLHEGQAGLSKFKFTTSGISFGADYRFTDRFALGMGGGYNQNTSKIGADGTRDDATSYVGAVYGTYHLAENIFLDGVLGYGALHYKTQRYVSGLGDFAFGHRNGDEAFGSITASYEYRAKPLFLSPYLRIDVVDGTLNAFTETGSVQSLAYASQSVQAIRSTLGAHGDYPIKLSGGLFIPRFRIEYQHDFEGSGSFRLQYADWLDGPTYSATADPLDHDHLLLGLGADIKADATVISIDLKSTVDNASSSETEIMAKVKTSF